MRKIFFLSLFNLSILNFWKRDGCLSPSLFFCFLEIVVPLSWFYLGQLGGILCGFNNICTFLLQRPANCNWVSLMRMKCRAIILYVVEFHFPDDVRPRCEAWSFYKHGENESWGAEWQDCSSRQLHVQPLIKCQPSCLWAQSKKNEANVSNTTCVICAAAFTDCLGQLPSG